MIVVGGNSEVVVADWARAVIGRFRRENFGPARSSTKFHDGGLDSPLELGAKTASLSSPLTAVS